MGRTLLVPLDRSPGGEVVLSTAEALARAEHAAVRLLHVAPRVEALVEDDRIVAYADEEATRVSRDVLEYLRTAAAALAGVAVELAVRFGDPATEILREAESTGADLIAMATHRRAGLPRLLEGSVAQRVLRASPVPVLLVTHGDVAEEPAGAATGGPHGRVVRRYFWCALHQREVEVELEEQGIPGFRTAVAVRSCSVFEPPTAIDCERRCLDPTFRVRWASPVPGVIQRLP